MIDPASIRSSNRLFGTPAWIEDHTIFPTISIVIPMLNEEAHIGDCLRSILDTGYPQQKLQIIVVDGQSADRSVNIIEEKFIHRGAPVEILTNPTSKTPRSLNIGVAAATGELVVILGAHSQLDQEFLLNNLENLRAHDAVCSGGTLLTGGTGRTQHTIGETMSHPFGLSSAAYRYRTKPGFTRTVVFGMYRREIFKVIGEFDESGEMAEDAEFNWRIAAAGYGIWFDPRVKTIYYPRENLRLLAKQLYNYGLFRAQMYRKHRRGLTWLHFMPPAAVSVAIILVALVPVEPMALPFLMGLTTLYSAIVIASSLYLWASQKLINPIVGILAFVTIHVGWGVGFLIGLTHRSIRYSDSPTETVNA